MSSTIAMSTLPRMRIIAVPLTRPRISPVPGKLARLTYYQFQQFPTSTKAVESKGGWLPREGVVNWLTNKGESVWNGFGKSPGGWKLKVYQMGQSLVDRIEFEEFGLKSFDPSFGPSISQLKRSPVLDEKQGMITMSIPSSIQTPSEALSELVSYTQHRIPRHRRGFYFWMVLAPLTTPFMLIPIIPNLPFFFCVWRSWSHYRAYKSSQYLSSLLSHDLVVPETDAALDKVYAQYAPPKPTPTNDSPLLLLPSATEQIAELYEFDPVAVRDLQRAMEQAQVRVASGHAK